MSSELLPEIWLLDSGQWAGAGHTVSLLNIHPAQLSPGQARVQHKLAISGWWRDHCGQVRRGLSRARSRQHKCMKTVPIMDRLTDCSETLAYSSSIHSWSRVLYIYRLLSILAVYKITPLIISNKWWIRVCDILLTMSRVFCYWIQ